jgi:hypothetical protein
MARRKTPQQRFEQWSPDRESDKTLDINLSGGNQFATRERANDFIRLMRSLPDPDPILRRMGRNIGVLRELLTDSHLESVWSVRCSASGFERDTENIPKSAGYQKITDKQAAGKTLTRHEEAYITRRNAGSG